MAPIRSTPNREPNRKDRARYARNRKRKAEAAHRELDEQLKASNRAPEGRTKPLSREQMDAISRRYDPSVKKVIRDGRAAPRTWDEINSTKAGGRDHGKYG